MPGEWALIPIALVLAVFGTAFIVLVPRQVLLVLLIVFRSVADVGSSSAGGPLLPGTIISGVIAVTAILATALPGQSRLSPRIAAGATVVVAALAFWTLVTVSRFGFSMDYVGEGVRAISLVAVLVLAYRVGLESGDNLPRWLNWAVGIPSVIAVMGYIGNFGPTMNTTGRATGTFAQANQAAAFFAVGAVACIWGYWKTKQSVSLVVAFSALVALLFTQSLGALAALGCGATVLFALNSKLSPGRRIALILLGLGMVLTLFLSIGASGRLTDLQGVDYGDAESDNSLDWRFVNWQALLPIWWDSAPVLGLGFGSTRYEVRPLGQAPHSIVVQILVEAGIVGACLAIVLATMLGRSIRRRYRENPESAAVLAAISTIVLVHGLAANWLNYAGAQYLALVAVGVLLGHTSLSRGSAGGSGPHLGRSSLATESK